MGQNSHDQCIYRDKIKTTLIVGGAKVYELLWGLTVFYLLSLFLFLHFLIN